MKEEQQPIAYRETSQEIHLYLLAQTIEATYEGNRKVSLYSLDQRRWHNPQSEIEREAKIYAERNLSWIKSHKREGWLCYYLLNESPSVQDHLEWQIEYCKEKLAKYEDLKSLL